MKVWDKKGGSILELKLKGKFAEEWKNEEKEELENYKGCRKIKRKEDLNLPPLSC